MPLYRRDLLRLAAVGAAAGVLASVPPALASEGPTVKAVAFDAFPILDPRPVFALAEQLFPGRGAELSGAWRTRQFEYQWLRALSGRYADFRQTTEDALLYAAELLRLDLTPEKRTRLTDAYLELKSWPDAASALESLRGRGLRLGFLSNATPQMLEAGVRNSNLGGAFEQVLSTDKLRTYKPDPRAYRMAVDAFGLAKEEVLFVAFAGWDAAGAKSFGYTTFWVNRMDLPAERLGVAPDGVGKDLGDLVRFVESLQRK